MRVRIHSPLNFLEGKNHETKPICVMFHAIVSIYFRLKKGRIDRKELNRIVMEGRKLTPRELLQILRETDWRVSSDAKTKRYFLDQVFARLREYNGKDASPSEIVDLIKDIGRMGTSWVSLSHVDQSTIFGVIPAILAGNERSNDQVAGKNLSKFLSG